MDKSQALEATGIEKQEKIISFSFRKMEQNEVKMKCWPIMLSISL
jgi:hypothetical protein